MGRNSFCSGCSVCQETAVPTFSRKIFKVCVEADALLHQAECYVFTKVSGKFVIFFRADRVAGPYDKFFNPPYFVGADDSVRPQDAHLFSKAFGKFAIARRADVGIGPYDKTGEDLRIRREFPKNRRLLCGRTASSAPTKQIPIDHTQTFSTRRTAGAALCSGCFLIGHTVCLFKKAVKRDQELKAGFDPVCQLWAAAARVEGVHALDGKRAHIVKPADLFSGMALRSCVAGAGQRIFLLRVQLPQELFRALRVVVQKPPQLHARRRRHPPARAAAVAVHGASPRFSIAFWNENQI